MADLIDRAALIAEYEYLKAECYEASGDAIQVDGYKVGGFIAIRNAVFADSDIDLASEINSGYVNWLSELRREDGRGGKTMTKKEILALLDKVICGGFELAEKDESDGYYKGVLSTVWTIIGTLLEEENE